MYFKGVRLTACSVMSVLIFSNSGCSWKPGESLRWGEENPPTSGVRVNLSKYGCLSKIDENVDQYLSGNLSEGDVNRLGKCVRDAIQQFKDKMIDLEDGSYKPERLAKFLNTEYFKEEKRITPQLLHEIMQIKKVVLGGTEEIITAKELDGMLGILKLIEDLAVKNMLAVKVYQNVLKGESQSISRAQLAAVRSQLNETARIIAELFHSHNNHYSISSGVAFIRESRKLLNWSQFHVDILNLQQLEGLAVSFKELTTGSGGDIVAPLEWQNLLVSFSTVFGFYITYRAKIKGADVKYGPSYEALVDTVNETFGVVGRWIDIRKDRAISLKTIDKVLASLEGSKLLPLNLSAGSLAKVIRQLIWRGLRTGNESGRVPEGLDKGHLNELKKEFEIWSRAQGEINQIIQDNLNIKFSDVENVPDDLKKKISELDFSSTSMGLQFFGVNDRASQSPIRPLFRINDRRAFVLPEDRLAGVGVSNNVQNLSYMNVMNSIARLMIRSFGSEINIRNMNGLTEAELVAFYSVIKEIGVELKFVDPRKPEGGVNYFIEASLFTFSGNGITKTANNDSDVLSYNEMIEFMSILWSSSNIRKVIYEYGLKKCPLRSGAAGGIDPLGQPKILRECFERHFFDHEFFEFSNLPHMESFVRALNKERRVTLLQDLQRVGRIACENRAYIESGEIAVMSTVLHYAEVIFTIYDKNRDGVLDEFELMGAFPRFSGYLQRELLRIKGKDYPLGMVKSIFAFLVKEKRIPLKWDDFGRVTILWDRYVKRYFDNDPQQIYTDLPEMKLDRAGLVKVLSVLAREARREKSKACGELEDDEVYEEIENYSQYPAP